MNEWLSWFISLVNVAVNWLSQMTIFEVPLISILVGIFIVEVAMRALLYKA